MKVIVINGLLLGAIMLAACASPAPEFSGAVEQRVNVGGTEFAIYQKADRVQVLRMGYANKAAREDLPEKMIEAAEIATKCQVRPGTIKGDTGAMRADLRCD